MPAVDMQQGAERARGPSVARAEHDVVEDGHLPKGANDLMGQCEPRPPPRRSPLFRYIDTGKPDAASIWMEHSSNEPDQRRLAGAVRPDQPDEIALIHGKGYAVDRLHAAEADRQIVELERRAHDRLT